MAEDLNLERLNLEISEQKDTNNLETKVLGSIELNQNSLVQSPILPRSGWNNELTRLRVLLKAKLHLDNRKYNISL